MLSTSDDNSLSLAESIFCPEEVIDGVRLDGEMEGDVEEFFSLNVSKSLNDVGNNLSPLAALLASHCSKLSPICKDKNQH